MESLARPGGTRTLWVWSRVITMGFQSVSGRLACLAAEHEPDGVVGTSGWYQNSVGVVSCNYHGFPERFRTASLPCSRARARWSRWHLRVVPELCRCGLV